MTEKTVTNAILKINPNAEVTVRNIYDIDNCEIEWLNGTTPISIEDIMFDFFNRKNTDFDNNSYCLWHDALGDKYYEY